MDSWSLGLVLDDDGGDIARFVAILVSVAALALILAVALPVVLLSALFAPLRMVSPIVPSVPPRQAGLVAVAPPHMHAEDVARRYLGVPYVFGGTDPTIGLDCSGLVQLVYRQLGIQLPRTAQQQYAATERIGDDQLQPGDLVFFARTYTDPNDWVTHVGIYIGNGQQINAPTTGQVVSIQSVFSGFWGAHYIGGGRVRGS